MVDTSDTMADSDTTARGLLMLRPIPTFFMEDLDMDTLDTPDTSDTMAMDSDTCTARGLLMLRLSLRPIPTFFMEDTLDSRTPRILWRTRTLWIRIRQILLRQIDYIKIFQ